MKTLEELQREAERVKSALRDENVPAVVATQMVRQWHADTQRFLAYINGQLATLN